MPSPYDKPQRPVDYKAIHVVGDKQYRMQFWFNKDSISGCYTHDEDVNIYMKPGNKWLYENKISKGYISGYQTPFINILDEVWWAKVFEESLHESRE